MRKNVWTGPPTELQLDLLIVLHERERGAAELLEVVAELREEEAPLATFYRHLQRAADAGWLKVRAERAGAVERGPGRPERHYQITSGGVEVLRDRLERHQRRLARARDNGLLSERAL